jgi:8-oxo-dGTP pyrophosphatase MutT (NUDIX family)
VVVDRLPPSLQRRVASVFGRLPVGVRQRVVRTVRPNYVVGTLVYICDSERVLMVRNAQRPGWGLPGGLLNRNEYAADGARREVREETGLDIELVGEPIAVVAPGPRRVDLVWTAQLSHGVDGSAPSAGDGEILAIEWFSRSSLPTLQHNATEAIAALVRDGRLP